MLKGKIEKQNQLKKEQKNLSNQLELTCQICDPSYETEITQ
jgi:hypothetical protein